MRKQKPLAKTLINAVYGFDATTTQTLFSRIEVPLSVRGVQRYKTHYELFINLIEGIINIRYDNSLKVKSNIVLLDMMCCYRGWRHFKGLPVRGQRT